MSHCLPRYVLGIRKLKRILHADLLYHTKSSLYTYLVGSNVLDHFRISIDSSEK